MKLNRLGATGLYVSQVCLGAMTFGEKKGPYKAIGAQDQAEANLLVRRALDEGVNFFDTANTYSGGESERILGQSFRDLGVPRHKAVIATKVFALGAAPVSGKGSTVNDCGLSRRHIMHAADESLKRLGTDHIDLYQCHGFDPLTEIEETLRAFDDLVRAGKVRYIGLSNWAAWQVATALGISERCGLARFQSVQAYYSIAGRDLEREVVPMMQHHRVGLMVWSPLAGGWLSGKYADGSAAAEDRRKAFDFPPVDGVRGPAVIAAMRPVAAAHGCSVARIALAWLLHQPHVTSVIVGAKRPAQLEDNLAALQVTLSADELAALDRASALPPEYPGWMTGFWGRLRQP
jgi:aryl-alcohol dehydrogenase-like predicted oxidoreductase